MSRKNQKKDEENAGGKVLTGLAVGVAVAAAGAAIGYFGRQLFNAWQADQEKEQQGASGTTSSCADKLDEEEKEFKRHDEEENRRRRNRVQDNNAPVNNASLPSVTVKKSAVSLHDQLMMYYDEYVDIKQSEIVDAQKVVEEVKSVISCHLRDPKELGLPLLKIGDLVPFGSTTEGLKVIHPDLFDVMVPIKLQSDCTVRGLAADVSCITIEVQSGAESAADPLCDGNHRLLARNLANSLLAPIQQACGKCRFSTNVSLTNSSVTVLINHLDGQPWTSINFVPTVIVDNKLFIPGQINSAILVSGDTSADHASSVQWHTSYARQEQWSVDRFDSTIVGHRIAVKILKAIRLNHREQFGQLSSYHVKNLLFHVLDDLPDSSDWDVTAIGERMIDLLARLTQALNEHHLPNYFEQSVNLLDSVPSDQCISLAKFIEKKIGHNDIASLLERRL